MPLKQMYKKLNDINERFFNTMTATHSKLFFMSANALAEAERESTQFSIVEADADSLIKDVIVDYNAESDELYNGTTSDVLNILTANSWLTKSYNQNTRNYEYTFCDFTRQFISFTVSYLTNKSFKGEESINAMMVTISSILNGNKESTAYKYPYQNGIKTILSCANNVISECQNIKTRTDDFIAQASKASETREVADTLIDLYDEISHGYLSSIFKQFNIYPHHVSAFLQFKENVDENINDLYTRIVNDADSYYKGTKEIFEIRSEITRTLNNVLDILTNRYPVLRKNIDKALDSTVINLSNKIQLLRSTDKSATDMMNNIIKRIGKIPDCNVQEILSGSFKLMDRPKINFGDLYWPHAKSEDVVIEPLYVPELGDEQEALDSIETGSTVSTANRIAARAIGQARTSCYLSEKISFKTRQEVIEYIILCAYKDDKNSTYDMIECTDRLIYGSGTDAIYDCIIAKKIETEVIMEVS